MKAKKLAAMAAALTLLCSCMQNDLPNVSDIPVQTAQDAQGVLAALDSAASGIQAVKPDASQSESAANAGASVSSQAPPQSEPSKSKPESESSRTPASPENLRPKESVFSKDLGYEVISPFKVVYDTIREGKEKYGNPPAVRPDENVCTISINCRSAIDKGVNQKPGFTHLPADGWILKPTEVEFEDGDCVFQVLARTVIERGIHMEYTGVNPLQYIEGIDNLYEFDGGRWSGWMHCVNDWYPNFGCGQYDVEPGDVIEINFTCDLGADLGQTWLRGGIDVDEDE